MRAFSREPVSWVLLGAITICAPLQIGALLSNATAPVVTAIAVTTGGAQTALLWIVARRLIGGARSAPLCAVALLWGGCVVPVIGVFANGRHSGALNAVGLHSFGAAITAPLDEDLLRLAGTVGVLSLIARPLLTMRDGLLHGFLVGAGFEVAENLSFVLAAPDPDAALQAALVRSSIGFGLHAVWTGATGTILALCLVRHRDTRRPRWLLLVPGVGIPMLLHAAWDAPALSIAPDVMPLVPGAVMLASLTVFLGCLRTTSPRPGR